MEVSKNKSLPIKSKIQAKLGHSWLLLGTLGNSWTLFGISDIFGIGFRKNFTLLDSGLNSLKYRITCWTNILYSLLLTVWMLSGEILINGQQVQLKI